MAYKGKYQIKNTKKYLGDPTKVTYRSLWERQAFKWCENNPRVKRWNSEEIVVPYKCKTDGKLHRYFVDLLVEFDNKDIIRYIREVMTYAKNTSKWTAADQYAKHKGWKFQVWTEDTLKNLGIKLLKS
jgi:hypothetical protein